MVTENATPTKVRALSDVVLSASESHKKGETWTVTRDIADVLVLSGEIEIVEEKKRQPNPPAGQHNRRDQRPEE